MVVLASPKSLETRSLVPIKRPDDLGSQFMGFLAGTFGEAPGSNGRIPLLSMVVSTER